MEQTPGSSGLRSPPPRGLPERADLGGFPLPSTRTRSVPPVPSLSRETQAGDFPVSGPTDSRSPLTGHPSGRSPQRKEASNKLAEQPSLPDSPPPTLFSSPEIRFLEGNECQPFSCIFSNGSRNPETVPPWKVDELTDCLDLLVSSHFVCVIFCMGGGCCGFGGFFGVLFFS